MISLVAHEDFCHGNASVSVARVPGSCESARSILSLRLLSRSHRMPPTMEIEFHECESCIYTTGHVTASQALCSFCSVSRRCWSRPVDSGLYRASVSTRQGVRQPGVSHMLSYCSLPSSWYFFHQQIGFCISFSEWLRVDRPLLRA